MWNFTSTPALITSYLVYCSIYPLHLAHSHSRLTTGITTDHYSDHHQPPGDVTEVTCPRVSPDSLTSLQNHFVPPPGPGLGSAVSVRCRSRSLGSAQLIRAVTLALMGTTLVIITALTDNFNWQLFPEELYLTVIHTSTVFVLNGKENMLLVFYSFIGHLLTEKFLIGCQVSLEFLCSKISHFAF